MHNCNIENVKFYLDENEYISSEEYRLQGWIFGMEDKVEDLRLVLTDRETVIESEITFPMMRPDVRESYPDYERSGYSGFRILFNAPAENEIILEAKIKGKWSMCTAIYLMVNRLMKPSVSGVNLYRPPSVLAVDNFYTDPYAVRELALEQEYIESQWHKGKRTELKYILPGTREKIEQLLGKTIINWSSQPYNGVFQYCTPADPIVYHYDSQRYAGVVFLTPDAPPQAGTSFYRHRNDRWLTNDPSEYNHWADETHLETYREATFGTEHDDFLDGSKWEEVDRIGNRFNRFAMWDATLIHAATSYFGKSKDNGRLFHMFFFDAI
jgi:hypothetical protein